MDIHRQERLVLVVPDIIYRKIDKEIVVGCSHLKERLAAFDILEHILGVGPHRICRSHVGGSIELPSWPWIIDR